MTFRWVVDPAHPSGQAVVMTPAEQAQFDADQAAAVPVAAAAAAAAGNEAAIVQAVAARLSQIRQARTALAGGNIFASFSVNEKAVIDGLLLDDIYLGRLALELFDAAT